MTLVSSGPMSMGDINVELGRPRTAQISLDTAEKNGYASINTNSNSRPSSSNPATISEWYNYDHSVTAPTITITSYSSGNLYFSLSGTGYSPTALTIKTSTSSSSGPWISNTAGSTSPRSVGGPTVTTWYQIQDPITPSIISNVYQYLIVADTTPPSAPYLYPPGVDNMEPSITLSWSISSDSSGISGYQLWRETSGGGYNLVFNAAFDELAYVDYDVSINVNYNYLVIAIDTANNLSDFSNVRSVKINSPCFVEGTLISLPDGKQVPIELLELNQLLLSAEIETLHDTNDVLELYNWKSSFLRENRISSPITKIEPKIAYETIIINNGLLEATPSHSQLIQRNGIWKFIPLGSVNVGDKLYGINGEIIAVNSVSINLEKRNIYPMTLSPSHTYFANGILTHNIKDVG